MAKWCREREISYNQFVYWKSKLAADTHGREKIASARFVELVDTPEDPGIVLECAGVQIRLTSNFDEATLQRCVYLLRKTV